MNINYVTDNNGNAIAVQIPIDEWMSLIAKYPDIKIDQAEFDIPDWQKEVVLSRKRYYEENPNELLSWEEAKNRLYLK